MQHFPWPRISNEGKSWIQFSPLSGRNWKDGWFMVKEETRCLLSLMSLFWIIENEDTSTVLSISGIQYRSSFKTVSSRVAKILAPCLTMTKILETEFGGNRKRVALLFSPGKRKHSRLVPQELWLPIVGNRERFYILLKVLHFFFLLQSFKMATAGIRQLLYVLCPWPSFWNVKCYKRV